MGQKKHFFSQEPLGASVMKLQLKKNIETPDISLFLRSDKEPLFTRIKFHYNRMLVLDLNHYQVRKAKNAKAQAGDVNCIRRKIELVTITECTM